MVRTIHWSTQQRPTSWQSAPSSFHNLSFWIMTGFVLKIFVIFWRLRAWNETQLLVKRFTAAPIVWCYMSKEVLLLPVSKYQTNKKGLICLTQASDLFLLLPASKKRRDATKGIDLTLPALAVTAITLDCMKGFQIR